MTINPKIFAEYDIRGIYPRDINASIAFALGKAIADYLQEKKVAVGHDMRISSDEISENLIKGLTEQGVDVLDLGLICTDMIYYISGKYKIGGVMITASHNPSEYNGLKVTKAGAISLSGETGFYQIRDIILANRFKNVTGKGQVEKKDFWQEYIKHALSFVDVNKIKSFKVVVDAGNGMGGKIVPEVSQFLPLKIIPLYFKLDGTFPNHIPNPVNPQNTATLQKKIIEEKADFGIAFDGDGDRMFLFDENGKIITGTIMTALIAEMLLKKNPGATILYNAVCGRIVPETITKYGGKPIRTPVGYSLIKQVMRKNYGLFAGEHSGHYFFKENYYSDSGLVAALISLELISEENKPLSQITQKYYKYFQSGEINFQIEDKEGTLKKLEDVYKAKAQSIDWLHGITVNFSDWWFNSYPSGTEPLLRLNLEADNPQLLQEKTQEVVKAIQDLGGIRK